jgi:hypothetical protein
MVDDDKYIKIYQKQKRQKKCTHISHAKPQQNLNIYIYIYTNPTKSVILHGEKKVQY